MGNLIKINPGQNMGNWGNSRVPGFLEPGVKFSLRYSDSSQFFTIRTKSLPTPVKL